MLLRQSSRFSHNLSSSIFSVSRRTWSSSASRFSSAEQLSAYRNGISRYRVIAGPFGKVFLGAVLTYQTIYWIWLKLETDEEKLEKTAEVAALEKQARELAAAQK